MTIDTIRERVNIMEKLWNRNHDKKVIAILLSQLTSDIVFFLGEKVPDELDARIDKLYEEIQ